MSQEQEMESVEARFTTPKTPIEKLKRWVVLECPFVGIHRIYFRSILKIEIDDTSKISKEISPKSSGWNWVVERDRIGEVLTDDWRRFVIRSFDEVEPALEFARREDQLCE